MLVKKYSHFKDNNINWTHERVEVYVIFVVILCLMIPAARNFYEVK